MENRETEQKNRVYYVESVKDGQPKHQVVETFQVGFPWELYYAQYVANHSKNTEDCLYKSVDELS